MWAAKLDIPLSNVSIDLETDLDARGQLGVGDVNAGYSEVRYTVSLESSASDEDIARLVEATERNSPLVDIFTREQKLVRNIQVVKPEA